MSRFLNNKISEMQETNLDRIKMTGCTVETKGQEEPSNSLRDREARFNKAIESIKADLDNPEDLFVAILCPPEVGKDNRYMFILDKMSDGALVAMAIHLEPRIKALRQKLETRLNQYPQPQ